MDDAGAWIRCFSNGPPPAQGWKLHISAGPDPELVLERCLQVLAGEDVNFKVLSSRERLIDLSCGNAGISQIGKFIAVYPPNDAEAVRLAHSLDRVTDGCKGPRIPSDRSLRPGSLVHYRYGDFCGRVVQNLLGVVEPAVTAPGGGLVPAAAGHYYRQFDWTADPFRVDLEEPQPSSQLTFAGGRFVTVRLLRLSARGATWLAIDTETLVRCVIKEAKPWVVMGKDGSDARDRLRHEAAMLHQAAALGIAPRSLLLFEEGDSLYLAMEDLGGQSLESIVAERLESGQFLDNRTILKLDRAVSDLVRRLHEAGLVHRDLKPGNIVFENDRAWLVDFELCLPTGSRALWGIGTPGYASRAQTAGGRASPSDDYHALAATTYFVATACEPTAGPRCPTALINPRLSATVRRVIDAGASETDTRQTIAESATRLALALKRVIRKLLRGEDQTPCHLNDGLAGAVLAWSEWVRCFPSPGNHRLLVQAARHLADRRAPHKGLPPLWGLFVGEVGVAVAILRAGLIAGDRSLIEWASNHCLRALDQEYTSPDLFHGTAGRIWGALRFWEATSDRLFLEAAVKSGDLLLAKMDRVGGRRTGTWTIPAGYSGLSGDAYFGLAHGAAGIAGVLLELYTAAADSRFRDAARITANRLKRKSVSVGRNGKASNWPRSVAANQIPGPYWCHGAAGIGDFGLLYWRMCRDPQGLLMARAAAKTVDESGRWIGPTQCHGLAGSIEFLLDLHQVTSRSRYLDSANSLGSILARYRDEAIHRTVEQHSIGYMTGYPGILTALLRLMVIGSGRVLGSGFIPGSLPRAGSGVSTSILG